MDTGIEHLMIRSFLTVSSGTLASRLLGFVRDAMIAALLGASAAVKALAVLPFLMTIGLDALELLVAFLQAYVFAMLTCMYLNDALHPGH